MEKGIKWKQDSHMRENETRTFSYTIQKNKLKWAKDLNIRPEIKKILEENMGDKFLNIGLGNDFLDSTPVVKARKTKNKQMGLHQTKTLLHSKGDHP